MSLYVVDLRRSVISRWQLGRVGHFPINRPSVCHSVCLWRPGRLSSLHSRLPASHGVSASFGHVKHVSQSKAMASSLPFDCLLWYYYFEFINVLWIQSSLWYHLVHHIWGIYCFNKFFPYSCTFFFTPKSYHDLHFLFKTLHWLLTSRNEKRSHLDKRNKLLL